MNRLATCGLVLALVLLTGCRTYGSFDSEELTVLEIIETHEQFVQELQRAQADLDALQRAGATNPLLAAAADEWAYAVGAHEIYADAHALLVEEAIEHEDDYRRVHRIYGAMISEVNLAGDRYRAIQRGLQDAILAGQTDAIRDDIPYQSRLQVAPYYFQKLAYDSRRISTNDLIRLAQGAAPADPSIVDPSYVPDPASATTDATATPDAASETDTPETDTSGSDGEAGSGDDL